MTHGLGGWRSGLPCAGTAALLALLALACGERDAPPPPRPDAGAEAPAPATPQEPDAPAPQPAPADRPPADEEPQPAPRREPSPAEPPAPEPSTQTRPPSPETPRLDLDELERRLADTRAIGFFTKLALKGDIEDLLESVQDHHDRGRGRLDALRERFDLLVMKVMGLLQDDDPDLARDLARSREDLWELLADPERFAALSS